MSEKQTACRLSFSGGAAGAAAFAEKLQQLKKGKLRAETQPGSPLSTFVPLTGTSIEPF